LAISLVLTFSLVLAISYSKGVGFHKPHLPFASATKYHQMQLPLSELKPPKYNRPPANSPAAAWHNGNFGKPGCTYNSSVSDAQAVVYRRAYYAAVSYTDDLIGEVLAELKRLQLSENTVVSFLGDHGWQLGEMDEWRKMTNWELGVRVPLIIRAPHKPASHGVKTPALAELVDLYPTLASLAGLPDPLKNGENIQGDELSPLFDAPITNGTGVKPFAYSQFAKQNVEVKGYGIEPWSTCTKCKRSEWDYMGYSLRSDRWRYTEWVSGLSIRTQGFLSFSVSFIRSECRMTTYTQSLWLLSPTLPGHLE
jgi:arylsulfatase A-like enzyme